MSGNADNFKTGIYKLTEFRIRLIIRYVVYCYLQILSDNRKYGYSDRGKIPKEEYLRNGLVNDYLQKSYNKAYFKYNISDNPSVDITFHPEETMTYIDLETNQKSTDKIDITIWENNLQSIWSDKTDNEIKFAIECKRIERLSDTAKYIADIKNFSNRNYTHTRLPFEGQIAFLEKPAISHISAKDEINRLLCMDEQNLLLKLTYTKIAEGVDYTYLSKHKRNYQPYEPFSIFHLLLDYSDIVIN
jgi:hypothetical protein